MPGTGAISYPSYTWTRPDAVLYPGGGRREYEYDPLMRITRILAKDPGKNILLDYSYSYDSMDNILSKQTGQGTYNYTYDALYRLTDVQVDIPGQENEGFSYDAVSNRLSEQGVDGEWTYNDNNELLTVATTEYTYDANGNATNLLLDGTVIFTYHYNAQDRLVQVDDVNGSTVAEYSYDPFGRRLWKEVGGIRTYFFYADEGLVAEYDTSGTELKSYGYRPGSTWTTDPLWLKQGGEYYFYQNDHLGTPQKLVQQNGTITWSASYTAFGQASVEVDAVENNLRFPGQYYDAETGLHYNWFRYYNPGIGRYLRADPMGFLGGDRNIYRYALDSPLSIIDFDGQLAHAVVVGWTLACTLATGAYTLYLQTVADMQDTRTGNWAHCYVNCRGFFNMCGFGLKVIHVFIDLVVEVFQFIGDLRDDLGLRRSATRALSDMQANFYGLGCVHEPCSCQECCSTVPDYGEAGNRGMLLPSQLPTCPGDCTE